MNDTEIAKIGSLWVGGALSWIELASIHSFVETGHDYVLYAYEDIPNVPPGIMLRDAREVWNTDKIIYHEKSRSPAIHADVFRALMIRETGRVWADTDVIALKPFPASLQWFIGHERDDRLELGNAIMGMPAESQTLARMIEFLTAEFPIPPWLNAGARKRLEARKAAGDALNLGELAWGSTGPKVLTYFAQETGEIEYAQPQGKFFPVSFQQRKHLVGAIGADTLHALLVNHESLCVHLYSRWLRKFTRGMPGGLPPSSSWLGHYLTSAELVDYKALDDQEAQKRKRQAGHKPLPKIDAQAFFDDLEERRRQLPDGTNATPYGRVTAVTMAKDEGPYILEWVAHHHLLGFTDILVYTNDCSDGTAEMFDALHELGILSHYDNPELGTMPPQSRALTRANQHPLIQNSDWIMVLDLDEFVNIRYNNGTVNDLLDVIHEKGATGMALTWRFYGSSGLLQYENLPVTKRFQRAADNSFTRGFGVKTLFKANPNVRLAIHRPRMKRKSKENNDIDFNWLNGSGAPVDGNVMSWRQTRRSVGYDLAQVNHYGVKSYEEFLMRRLRGDVLNNHGKYDSTYFQRFDRNEIEDAGALRYAKERDALISRFRKFKSVRQAEKLIHKRYAEKLTKLRDASNYADLMSDLRSC